MSEKKVLIEIGKEKAIAKLYDTSPKFAQAIWDILPTEGPASHAKTSGGEIMWPIPLYTAGIIPPEGKPTILKNGHIGYWSMRGTICIFYDELTPFMVEKPSLPVGEVIENLEGLQREGRKLWEYQGKTVKMSRYKE